MSQFQKVSLFLLRITIGWSMLYAGITKVLDPAWSAEGYIKGAKTFVGFYGWLITPNILPIVNLVNEWGLVLLGISLMLGLFTRISSILGAILMMLYYFPILDGVYPNPHSYIVDEHIIYALVLLVLVSARVGRVWGLENWCSNLPICSKFPKLRNLLG